MMQGFIRTGHMGNNIVSWVLCVHKVAEADALDDG